MVSFRKAAVFGAVIVLLLVSVSLSAQSMKPRRSFNANEDGNYVAQALQLLISEKGNKSLRDLSAGDLRKALGVISVARQQQAYVRRSEITSFIVPGAGQFMNHDPAAGALFLGAHLATIAGSLFGAYFLLPTNVQFSSINYFTESFANIHTAWMSNNFVGYLKPAAVLVAGMVVDHIIRHFSAENAGDLARTNIKNKKVTFQPEPFLLMRGAHGPRMGFGWRMRF